MLKICNLYLVTFLKMKPMFHATLHSGPSPVVYQQEVSSLPWGIFFFAAKICLAFSRHSDCREWVKNQSGVAKKLMRKKSSHSFCGEQAKNQLGTGEKSPRFFCPCVPFALDAYNLTCSPLSDCLEQAKICYDVHPR